MKKGLRLILFISLALLLTACDFLDLIPPITTTPPLELSTYEASSLYEKSVMEVSDDINNYNFTVVNDNGKHASATLIDKEERDQFSSIYVLVTTSSILEESNVRTLKISATRLNKSFSIVSYVVVEPEGLLYLKIDSTNNFKLPNYTKDTYYKAVKGQTLLSVGTPYLTPNYADYVNEGIVSDIQVENNADYWLIGDIASNYGNGGSGVYDLRGNLIGLTLERETFIQSNLKKYAAEGTTYILTMNVVYNLYTQLSSSDFAATSVSDQTKTLAFIKNEWQTEAYESTLDYENKVIEVTENIQERAVVIDYGETSRTGVIYKKENLTQDRYLYYVVTSSYEVLENAVRGAKINIGDNIYTNQDYVVQKRYNIIVYRFVSEETHIVNDLKTTETEGIEIRQGQTVLSLGIPMADVLEPSYVSKGILSKDNVLSDQSMWSHDVAVNPSMYGAPLFNLDGEWIGINFSKVNNLKTSVNDSDFYAEGLTYATSINALGPVLNSLDDLDFLLTLFPLTLNEKEDIIDFNYETWKPYQNQIDHEKEVIKVLADVYEATVAVSAGSSHGSGVIYRKEARSEGGYYYYVATNYHVIDGAISVLGVASNITIFLGNNMGSIEAIGYQGNKTYDIASLKITTRHELEFLEIKANQSVEKGQTIISLGSPYDYNLMFNHASVGVVSLSSYEYERVNNLAYMQDSSINPGNSGGPSYNLKGELMGLNVAKITMSRDYQNQEVPALGLGYTLNMQIIGPRLLGYRNFNEVQITPRLGITVQNIDTFKVLNSGKEIPDDASEGIVVIDVDINRGAYNQLYEYDLITHIGEVKIINLDSLGLLPAFSWDQVVLVTVIRNVNGNFEEVKVEVTISWDH